MDQLPRLGKRELICLLLFTCYYVVSVWRGFLFLWVLGMGYVILLWHSLSLPYNYSTFHTTFFQIGEFDWLSARQKGSIFVKMFKNLLLRNHKGEASTKVVFFIPVG